MIAKVLVSIAAPIGHLIFKGPDTGSMKDFTRVRTELLNPCNHATNTIHDHRRANNLGLIMYSLLANAFVAMISMLPLGYAYLWAREFFNRAFILILTPQLICWFNVGLVFPLAIKYWLLRRRLDVLERTGSTHARERFNSHRLVPNWMEIASAVLTLLLFASIQIVGQNS